MTNETKNQSDDPMDDSTHWVGRLPVSHNNGEQHTDQRNTGREPEPNSSRKKPPEEKGKAPKPMRSD